MRGVTGIKANTTMSSRRSEDARKLGLRSTLRHVGAMAAVLADAGAAVCALSSRLQEKDLDDIIREVTRPRRGHASRDDKRTPGAADAPRPRRVQRQDSATSCEDRLRRAMREDDVDSVVALARQMDTTEARRFKRPHWPGSDDGASADDVDSDSEVGHGRHRHLHQL